MRSRKIKICHLQLLPIMSGVQRAMLELLKRLDPQIYEVTVVCRDEGDLTKELRNLGIHFQLIPRLQREINVWKDAQALWQLYRLFKREKFDLIHTHSSKTGILGRVAGRLAGGVRIIHTVQGFPFHEFSGRFSTLVYSWIEKLAGMLTDQVVFVNNEERMYAIENRILRPDQVQTIYNGVDLARVNFFNQETNRQRFREAWGIPADAFVAAFVGRLWQQKDPQTLSRIITACADLPVHFLIVGDGPYLPHFQAAFAGQERIKLAGWMEDPFHMYPAIDVLLLPSLWEGLSITLIEAMAFGKPLIASNIKGNRECVQHGCNGLLCPPQQADEFKKAIQTIWRDHSLYQTMSQNCREMARQSFDVEQNTQRLLALYKEQLGYGG
ncbi:MAG TPA: glycosyltransferase family 4 protein [bacterium]|nr:glycosyltransferase family 4 protein [bacterium]